MVLNQHNTRRYIIYGQLCYLSAILVCVLLIPSGLAANNGFCFYGSRWQTFGPYLFGLIGLGWFYFKAARALPPYGNLQTLKFCIYTFLVLAIPAVETPFKFSTSIHTWHVLDSVLVFFLQVALALWIITVLRWDLFNIILIWLLTVEALWALASVYPQNGFLMQIEAAFQLTFAALLFRSLSPHAKTAS